jgi:outer membrane PBP1 activator LpoA protein
LPLPRPLNGGAVARTTDFPPADSDGYRPPAQLAVLLPITGNLATPAASVRDGILAAYFAENRRRPGIKVYDTAGTADGVKRAATQAVADGAQMILGPLTRDEVGTIFTQADVGVPIIALNRGPAPPTPGSASFSLSPEEEGFVAADHLADRHILKVFVISQHDDTAQRTLTAFREQLRNRGGDVVAELSVDGSTIDAMAIPQTAANAKAPPDAVFLSLRAAPARLVTPQLATSSISSLPRISSFADPERRRQFAPGHRVRRHRIAGPAVVAGPAAPCCRFPIASRNPCPAPVVRRNPCSRSAWTPGNSPPISIG